MQPEENILLEYQDLYRPSHLLVFQIRADYLTSLSAEDCDFLASFQQVPFDCIFVRAKTSTSMLCRNLLRRLKQESTDNFGSALFERSMLTLVLLLLLRVCILADNQKRHAKPTHLIIDEVFIFIREHLREDLSLEALEKEFYVSHEHICREFKRQTGQTIHRYILDSRLELSCRYLLEGKSSTQIWQLAGFHSYSYFLQAFKRKYCLTPKEYRLKLSTPPLKQ